MKRWLGRWFDTRRPVEARTYLQTGTVLLVFKYLTDALLVWLATGRLWRPTGYLNPLSALSTSALADAPGWLFWALAFWTVPFLVIGASMTMRRAVDAGFSPWVALLFFVPIINYVVMLALVVLPTADSQAEQVIEAPIERAEPKDAVWAALAGLAVVLPSVVFGAVMYRRYNAGLFLGTPFTLGVVTAYVFNRNRMHSVRATLATVAVSIGIAGVCLMAVALEGAVCIAMTLPLVFAIALPGGLLGRAIAVRASEEIVRLALLVLAAPLLAAMVPAGPARLHEVRTSREVDAPPAVVWRHVVSFDSLPGGPTGIFRLGIARPVHASIAGAGVGAIRRCEFSTGAFIEPITVWDAPRRLAFDVTSSPPPLIEWSPWRNVRAPHLQGFLQSRRGEFRLVALPGGRTRLEGSTWYQLDVHPGLYWRPWADAIISRIHMQVLNHVAGLAEAEDAREP